jgi:beta-fructofuranosidase
MKYKKTFIYIIFLLSALFLIGEIVTYIYVEAPLETDFYGSISKDQVHKLQSLHKVKCVNGNNWIHLGWIANPDTENYIIEIKDNKGTWQQIGASQFGSFLYRGNGGQFRVIKVNKKTKEQSVLGMAKVFSYHTTASIYKPVITDNYRPLFKPQKHGYYINDHTIFKDSRDNWRLIGITSKTDGDPNAETYFAVAKGKNFPHDIMVEEEPIADVGDLAWAPHVVKHNNVYHMFWSPHKLHHMTSHDGIHWENHTVIMKAPYNKFFRDCMILQVSEDQWLMYTTARGLFFSQIDVYQSFDLEHWQYIRTALSSSFGSERNSPFASMESPFVVKYNDGYYLSVTYNNDTLFIHGLLLLFKVWLDTESYNDTLVFYSDNPYDFGIYRGKKRSDQLIATLRAHAPEWVYVPATKAWYITTCGWKWVATLTKGEVAIVPVKWQKIK